MMALNRYNLFLQKGRVFYSCTTIYLISLLLMEIEFLRQLKLPVHRKIRHLFSLVFCFSILMWGLLFTTGYLRYFVPGDVFILLICGNIMYS